MKEILEYILQRESITNTRLAALLDVAPASITHIMSGRNKPSYDFLVKLVETFPQYDARWVLTGKGEPMVPSFSQQNQSGKLQLFASQSSQDAASAADSCPIAPKSEATKSPLTTECNCRLIVCFPDNTFVEYVKKQ